MTKQDLLAHLSDVGVADAAELANALGVSYATSAMALLRLVRQHLASRVVDPHRGRYTYQLTDYGHARLAFFEDEGPTHTRARRRRAPRGDLPFPRKETTV